MSADAIVALSVCAPIGLGVLALIIHVFTEGAEDKLWPRGLRWFPGLWLDNGERLHRLMLKIFWPEKLPAFKGRRLLHLEAYDQEWRTWSGIGAGGIPEWQPWPGRLEGGRWAPRPETEAEHVEDR